MLSKTSKLGCLSWSLQAFETCPGSVQDGVVVDACKFCYARTGMYHMPDVKALRSRNKEDWKNDDWVSRMVHGLRKSTHFRWFDSGDMYSTALAEKILEVCRLTPNVNHWIPTRMHKFEKFRGVLEALSVLPNVVVRLSSDSVSGGLIDSFTGHSSTITPYAGYFDSVNLDKLVEKYPFIADNVKQFTEERQDVDVYECVAYKQGGKCLTCRACWDKMVPVVAYPYHGKSKAKVIKILQVKG